MCRRVGRTTDMRTVLVCLVAVACSSTPKAPDRATVKPDPALERVDVFGSKHFDRDQLIARYGSELVELVRAVDANDDAVRTKKEALEAKLTAAGKFALVDIAIITYFSPNRSYVTVDLVDEADRARRMTFAAAPTGEHPDPDNLLALWREYQDKAMGLLMDGKITPTAEEKCPFFHCITFAHESLAQYKDAFAKRVPPHETTLAKILREDKRDEHRALAAFLLAHISSGQRVVELMLPVVRDPSELVRNNAMRVLAMIAQNYSSIPIPVAPVIEALHYPTTTDRNKASAILDGIAKHADAQTKAAIKIGAGEVLVQMLALRQPNNHDFAYSILKSISGQDFGEHGDAIDKWRAWVRG